MAGEGTVRVVLQVRVAGVGEEEEREEREVCVTGSAPELGQWDVRHCVSLRRREE